MELPLAPICSKICQSKIWATHKKVHNNNSSLNPKSGLDIDKGSNTGNSNGPRKGFLESVGRKAEHLNTRKINESQCCEPDLQDVPARDLPIYNYLQDLLNRLERGIVSDLDPRQKIIRGTLERLSDKDSLRETLFPGLTAELARNRGLPHTISEVLRWNGVGDRMRTSLVKMTAATRNVLDGVKARGKTQGQVMDQMTEHMLIPQIAQENFARSLVDTVGAVGKESSQIKKHALKPAYPEVLVEKQGDAFDPTSFNMLDASTLTNMQLKGFDQQASYLGNEWNSLIYADVERFCRDEEVVTLPKSAKDLIKVESADGEAKSEDVSSDTAKMVWLQGRQDILSCYPALQEALETISCLPYEFNSKSSRNSDIFLELDEQCIALLHFPPGSSLVYPLESHPGIVQLGGNLRIACAYHLTKFGKMSCGRIEGRPNKNRTGSASHSISIVNDSIVLYRPDMVFVTRTPADEEYYIIVVFFHGKKRTI